MPKVNIVTQHFFNNNFIIFVPYNINYKIIASCLLEDVNKIVTEIFCPRVHAGHFIHTVLADVCGLFYIYIHT